MLASWCVAGQKGGLMVVPGGLQPCSAAATSVRPVLKERSVAARRCSTTCAAGAGRAGSRGAQQEARGDASQAFGTPSTSGRSPAGRISELEYLESDFVELGYIKQAHGIKGEVKVELMTDSPKQRFGKSGTTLYLRAPQPKGVRSGSAPGPLVELTTAGYKVQIVEGGKEVYLLKFKEVADRDVAEFLRGYMIVLPLSQREPLSSSDEWYVQDLVGCAVFTVAGGEYVGRVVDMLSGFGMHETLQLNLRPTRADLDACRVRTAMVPFVKVLVPLVDKGARRMLVDPPEGLFDLASSKKAKALDEDAKLALLALGEQREAEERARRAAGAYVPLPANNSGGGGASGAADDDNDEVEDAEEEEEEELEEAPPPPRRRPRFSSRPAGGRGPRPAQGGGRASGRASLQK